MRATQVTQLHRLQLRWLQLDGPHSGGP